jgi:aldose 1-epimerase
LDYHSCGMRLRTSTIGEFPVLTLEDPSSGASLSVLPTRGATVHELVLPDPDGVACSLLQPMRTHIEILRHRWAKGAQLAPWPNRIQGASYEFQGQTYNPVKNFRPQGGHAIHGLVMFETAKLSAKSPENGTFELSLSSKGWQGYPFPVKMTFRFGLDPRKGFRMETEIENIGRGPCPVGHGWHPYFRLGDSIKPNLLHLPDGKRLPMTARAVPDGTRVKWDAFAKPTAIGEDFLDACVELSTKSGKAVTRLVDLDRKLSLAVWQETGPGKYGYLQVFTHPRRHCLAIEPMTCAPDAFHNGMGLVVLKPGESLKAACGVALSKA